MRQPDINRVKKAKEHLQAATTVLNSIKWENVNGKEYYLLLSAKDTIGDAHNLLKDIINIQNAEV